MGSRRGGSKVLRRWLTAGLVLLTAAAVESVAAWLATSPSDPPPPARPGGAGVRVVMNPETGEIVGQPTADQLGRVGAPSLPSRRRAEELERFDLPHGARGVVLDDWADHTTRLERGADGAWRVVCSQGDRHGEAR